MQQCIFESKATVNLFQLGGLEPNDVETKLYYLKAHYYDPKTGRFIAQDSTDYLDPETLGGINLFAYCNNNPVMYVDPSGHFGVFATLLISALITAALSAGANVAGQVIFEKKSFAEIEWGKVGISAAAGFISGFIPGSNFFSILGQAAVSSIVENGLLAIAYGQEFSHVNIIKDTAIQVATGYALKYVTQLTSKLTSKIFINKHNYSQYQHYFRSKGFNYSRNEVYVQMHKLAKNRRLTNEIIEYSLDFVFDFLTSPF